MRDDFKVDVKDILAKRSGVKCSNPNCRRPTSGPQEDPEKVLNVGAAAHITAASRRGPRYDPRMSAQERRSEENGIWLCQTCAKLVDNDAARYSVDLLRRWRRLAEEAALLDIEAPANDEKVGRVSDEDLIRFYAQCFDRPAFQDPFRQEGSMEAFDRAIEDTITAINTGCLRARDGGVLMRSKGKAFLERAEWRQRMDLIVDLLRAIRSRYDDARKTRAIYVEDRPGSDTFYIINDPEIADWMDQTRSQVLAIFGEVGREAGLAAPVFPRHRTYRTRW
jgi:hypothetical protein